MANVQYYDVILKPVITEKSMNAMGDKKYTFFVHPEATKTQSTDDKRHQNSQTFFNIFQCRVPGCDQIDDDRTEKDDKHRINTDCKITVIGRKFIFLDVIIRFVLFLQIHGHPPYKMFKKQVTSNYKRHGKLVQVFFLKKTIKKLKKKLAICKTVYYNMSCVRGNATQDMRD